MVTLPNQVRKTDAGKKIWIHLYRCWNFVFLAIGYALIVSQIVRPFAIRWEDAELVESINKILFLPVLFLTASFLFLFTLVIALRLLEVCKIIR